MRAIRAALSQNRANQTDQAQGAAALKPIVRRPPAPRALTGMFDPSKIGQRQNASARVVAWAKELLPDTVKQAIRLIFRTCQLTFLVPAIVFISKQNVLSNIAFRFIFEHYQK